MTKGLNIISQQRYINFVSLSFIQGILSQRTENRPYSLLLVCRVKERPEKKQILEI